MRLILGLLLGLMVTLAHAMEDYPLRAEKLRWNVYVLISPNLGEPDAQNKGWVSNQAFVVGEQGVLVFDSGGSEAIGAAVLKAIRAVTDKPIRWLVNSSAQGVHWLGNVAVAAPDTAIIASAAAAEQMAREGAASVAQLHQLTGGATSGATSLRLPTETIPARVTRQLGDLTVEFIPVSPAHAAGDLVLWLPKQRVLLAGDNLFIKRLPVTQGRDVPHWIEVLKDQLEPIPALHVVPGYGPPGGLGDLQLQRLYFEELWQRVAQSRKEGMTLPEITENVRQALGGYYIHYPNFTDAINASVADVYQQMGTAALDAPPGK